MIMKKTTTILLLLFVVLGSGAAWYFTTNTGKKKATYLKEDMEFAVDADKVYKVFLADRDGSKTTLLRKGDEWLLEGKYKIRPNSILYLKEVISKLEVKYRPPRSAYDVITKDLATYGVKVELFDEQNQLLKSYYVGGVDADGEGTFMIMEGSNEPYVMHIKNFVGGLRTRFAMKGDEWRDRSVFAEKPEDIIAVSIEYPKQKSQSFKLSLGDGDAKVTPFYNTTPIINKEVSTGKPQQFLEGFKSKIAENFQNNYTNKDFAKTITPFAILSLTKKDGTEKTVRFIPYQELDKNGDLVKQDPDAPVFRLHADCSWGDFMVIQHDVFKNLFWSYESFYE